VGSVGAVVVLGVVLAAGAAGLAHLRCVDAAGAGARAAARGEPVTHVQQIAARLAGGGVTVVTAGEGDLVRVTVTRAVRLPLPGDPRLHVRAEAVAAAEPAQTTHTGATP
jgi:hypothetical protein